MDRIVLSPGVPPLPALDAADAAGVPIASEVELACWFVEGDVLAITGTNGKSTVTSLVGQMAECDPRPSFVGGNLGTPLVDVVGTEAAKAGGLVVVELSSFQLERVDRFRPKVAAILNLSEDHLDRYESYAEYVAAKGRIFSGQKGEDHAVVPAGDEVCASLARAGAARIHTFGAGGELDVMDLGIAPQHMLLRGSHNVSNACAAALIAKLAGIDPRHVTEVLGTFPGLPHRMQHVRERGGVRYYDDSKATNVGAAVAALEGLSEGEGQVVWIVGGKDKGGSYAPLVPAMERVRAVVTLGEAAPRIEEELGRGERASTLEEAVALAAERAVSGDSVLLAPACSSYDMFSSYVERGEVFQAVVQALPEVE